MVQSPVAPSPSSVLSQPVVDLEPASAVSCTILTPSGALIGHGLLTPRASDHVAEAYSVQISDVDPPGALEALVYANQPHIVLRAGDETELTLRIDHITGPPPARRFFCHRG